MGESRSTGAASAVGRPLPEQVGLVAEFHELLAGGRLHLQYCPGCARWRYPARPACGASPTHVPEWRPVSGTGAVFSWTVTHQALHPAFAEDVPYVTVLVELDEGPRVLGRLHGVAPEAVRPGLRLRVRADTIDGVAVVAFVADGEVSPLPPR